MQVGSTQNSSTGLASAMSKLASFAYFDPKDTNQDGIVSATEDFAYALKHPEVELLKPLKAAKSPQASSATHNSPLNQYTQKGALNAWEKTTSNSFDLFA